MTVAGPSTQNNPLFRYPSIGLAEAVEKTRKLYQKIHRRRMSREEIAKNLGYTTLNGASAGVISNLTRYGLLVGRQDAVGISSDGIVFAIEEDINSPDRQAAVRRAAFTPEIFKELADDFGTDAVPEESSVRIRLEKRGFPRKQAEAASRAFCETMALVVAEGGAYNQPQVSPEAGDRGGTMPIATVPTVTAPSVPQTVAVVAAPAQGFKQDVFTLSEGDVTLRWPEGLSKESFPDLIDWLEVMQRKIARAIGAEFKPRAKD